MTEEAHARGHDDGPLVIGIDPSSVKTGYCLLSQRVLAHGVIRPRSMNDLFLECLRLLRKWKPDFAAVETQHVAMRGPKTYMGVGDGMFYMESGAVNFPSVEKLIMAAQTARCACYAARVPIRHVAPRDWQRDIPGAGSWNKSLSVAHAKALTGIRMPEDAADAFHMARACRAGAVS